MLLLRPLLFAVTGAAAGYAWHRLAGCSSGTCVITARWWTATLYGAAVGFAMGAS